MIWASVFLREKSKVKKISNEEIDNSKSAEEIRRKKAREIMSKAMKNNR